MSLPSFSHAMVLEGLLGGLLIGLAAAIMLLGLGRIAGVSGMAARAAGLDKGAAARGWSASFVIGLPLGAFLVALALGSVETRFPPSTLQLIAAGLLVGFGTRLGSGCTSGHGVCGLSRLSRRSMIATVIFMGAGFATVALMRVFGLLNG